MKQCKRLTQFFLILSLTLLLCSQAASAMTLQEAKQAGLVGEKSNGYVGVVGNAPPQVKALTQSINQKRRNKYKNIARSNGTSLENVETFAGKKTIQKTASGQYVHRNGGWVKK